MISAREARVLTMNSKLYKIFIERVEKDIEKAINFERYDVTIGNHILSEDSVINIPLEVMELVQKDLEKLGYKARVTNSKDALEISWKCS